MEQLNILVADDEKHYMELFERLLQKSGLNVSLAKNGKEAVNLLNRKFFDIVLTDLNMPEKDGFEVLNAAKEANPDTHVIIITGYATLESAIKAVKMGAYDYITKPFTVEELALLIKNVCIKIDLMKENRKLINELKNAYLELNHLKSLAKECQSLTVKSPCQKQTTVNELSANFKSIPTKILPSHYSTCGGKKPLVMKDSIDELELLGKLMKNGILTNEEFQICKSRILSEI